MMVIGLTGSIGMGKSTVAAMFRKLGIPVFDADAEVRRLQAPGGPALAAIAAAFPGTVTPGTVTPGTETPAVLNRARLGAAVFGNPERLHALEAILHPRVAAAQAAFRARHRSRRAIVLDIPLLFEKGGWQGCDLTVVVSAPLRVQRARVLRRPGMTPAKFAAIISAQLPDAEKRRRADVVIETGRGRRVTWLAVRDLANRKSGPPAGRA